jgi:cytochrome c-type biogenesis protein CcmE
MKPPHIIALAVIVICMVVMLFSFSGAIAQHVTIPQAMARPDETVQVPGNIVKDSVAYDVQKGELRFDILGVDPNTRKIDSSQRMTVVYAQPKPENFDAATSVEAIGRYQSGVFRAQNLLVKCPSKYSDDKPAQVAGK